MKNLLILVTLVVASLTFSQPSLAAGKSVESTKVKLTMQKQAININAADAKEIAKNLDGIGLKKAQAIVEYRQAHGEIKAIEELASIKGIGVKTLEKNVGRILL